MRKYLRASDKLFQKRAEEILAWMPESWGGWQATKMGDESDGEETAGEETVGEETAGEETVGEKTASEETAGEDETGRGCIVG